MQIHELNDFTGELGSGAFIVVDDGEDTGKVSTAELLSETNQSIDDLDDALNARIDNIIAPQGEPSLAELVDVRLGADGVTYATAGEAVRAQFTNVKADISVIIDDSYEFTLLGNVNTTTGWRINPSTGYSYADSSYKLVKYSVTAGDLLWVKSDDCFQFQNSSSVPSTGALPRIGVTRGVFNEPIVVPTGASYLIFSTPVTGSEHFVKKVKRTSFDRLSYDVGAVAKYAYLIQKDIELTQGYLINASTGKRAANADHWISDFIPVEEGMMFDYRLSASSSSLVIGAYSDLDATLISGDSVVGNGYANAVIGTYTVSSGTKYIRVCSLNWSAESSTEPSRVLGNFFRYSESKEEQPKVNKIDDLPFVSGRIIDANNRYGSNSDTKYKATGEFVKVDKGTIIKYALAGTANCPLISFYNKYKVFVSAPVMGTGGARTNILSGYITVPDGVEYARFFYYDFGISTIDIQFITTGINLYSDKAEMVRNARRYDFILESQSSLLKPLSILHFTDIHGTEDALRRIVNFKSEYNDVIDDAICTGDMVVASTNNSGMGFWDNVSGSEDILLTIGNHDLYDGTTSISLKDQYDMYIKPYMDNWNAETVENKTWWYKDYDTNKVRLIGLGSSYTMPTQNYTEQLEWFSSVLESALEGNYSVIVAQHYLPEDGIAIESNFTQAYGRGDGDLFIADALMTAIDTFINNGGDFICHICGHTHQDQILYSESHPRQLFICATTASSDFVQQQFGDQDRTFFGNALDAFNVITADINKKLLKVIRVGADQDMLLRSRKSIVIKYDTKEIISEQ